ncbi:hypothetical protein [Pelistega sp. MC2]|uniref:hypothetical protein n=1 Tax=Pelistega sp. MC2 TaxID=1720297 RepID=UPI0008DAC991|nr:hypothetical protein [Pelistega sp. MC2]
MAFKKVSDNANVRQLGSYQSDGIKAHTHFTSNTWGGTSFDTTGGHIPVTSDNSSYGSSTSDYKLIIEGMNTALHPRIIAF